MEESKFDKIGPFEVRGLLGKGGMAQVYRAYQSSLDRDIAIKVIDASLSEQEEFVQRFEREVSIIRRLEHPHILPVYETGLHEGQLYLAMRLVDGGSLADRIKSGSLPREDALRYLEQIARALTFAHEREVVHRDLKPANILLDEGGNAYLTDFGIAKMLDSASDLTATQDTIGTPAYMAPEQIVGTAVDARSDVYALGVLAYELLTGERPFSGSLVTVIQKHLSVPPPSPKTLRPELPDGVEVALLKALEKSPEARFQTAVEFVSSLSRAFSGSPPPLPQDSSPAVNAIGDDDTIGWARNPARVSPGPDPLPPAPETREMPSEASEEPAKGKKKPRSRTLIAAGLIGLGALVIGGAKMIGPTDAIPVPLAVRRVSNDGGDLRIYGTSGEKRKSIVGSRSGWSPDGRRLVSEVWSKESSSPDLVEVDLKTGIRRNLTEHPAQDYYGNYSPDGKWIVFHSNRRDRFHLYRMKADSREVELLEDVDANNQWAVYSPDGRTLAFASDRAGSRDIFVMDVETRAVRQLTNDPAADEFPAWSPDGEEIAFQSNRAGSMDIYAVKVNNGSTRKLTDHDADDRWPTWAPADIIAFVSERGDGGSNIYLMNPDGSDQTLFDDTESKEEYPTFGPLEAQQYLD